MSNDAVTVGLVGLTHLSINTAVALAERGFETVWFDPDSAVTERLDRGEMPVVEPDLDELFARNRARIKITHEVSDLQSCDVVYIAPDVPTDDTGKSDLSGIEALIARAAPELSETATLVVLCQVPPGFTRGIKLLPRERVFYQVETLIFGRAVERAMHPERYIIGCADPAVPLPPPFASVLNRFDCPILPMRYESAELAKIAINCCLVASITTANSLAGLCEKIGADWSEIAPALRLDKRIGPHAYLTPGLGFAGGNLERDLATILRLSEATGAEAGVVRAWLANSAHRKAWPFSVLAEKLLDARPDSTVGILGVAYKENTASTKNAPSLKLFEALGSVPGCRVQAYDPVVNASSIPLGSATESIDAVLQDADALCVLTPWDAFKDLEPDRIAGLMRGRLVIDPFAVLDGRRLTELGFAYHTLGKSSEEVPVG